MTSMSYCALENTVIEMEQIIEMLDEISFNDSRTERVSFERLKVLCDRFVTETEGMDFEEFIKMY